MSTEVAGRRKRRFDPFSDFRHPILRWGYIFMIPAVAYFAMFIAYPVIRTLYLSFTTWRGFGAPPKLIFFENYRVIFGDSVFLTSLKNTFVYTALVLPGSLIIPLVLSLIFEVRIRFRKLFTAIYFFPSITSAVAISLVWKWCYEPMFGLFNGILGKFGFARLMYLKDPIQVLPSIAIMAIWQRIGYNMVIYAAGLSNIPNTYYEAATIDGASTMQKIWRITLPLLMPQITFLLVTGAIQRLQVFTEVYMMTSGGPADASRTIAMYLYETAFHYNWFGKSSAMAVIMFLIIMAITIIQMRALKGRRN